jgi:hypothetical protein
MTLSVDEQAAVDAYANGVLVDEIKKTCPNLYQALEKSGVPRRQKGPTADPYERGRQMPSYGHTLRALQGLRPGDKLPYHVDRPGAHRDFGAFAAVHDEWAKDKPVIVPVQRRDKSSDDLIYLAVRL